MTTKTKTEFETIRSHAESIKNDADHDLVDTMDVGEGWSQGDILIARIARVPSNATTIGFVAQLAPGTTQGSRHTIRAGDGVTMYAIRNRDALTGPVFECVEPCWIDHPEHGNVRVPAGVYAITYQRAYADELRRVMD